MYVAEHGRALSRRWHLCRRLYQRDVVVIRKDSDGATCLAGSSAAASATAAVAVTR